MRRWSVLLTMIVVGCVAILGIAIVRESESEPKDVKFSCTYYEQGSTLRLTLRGFATAKEVAGGCGDSTESFSSASSYWVIGTPPLPESSPEVVCSLRSPDQPMIAIVEEVPGYLGEGESFCGRLAGAGWLQVDTVRIGPGESEYLAAVHDRERQEAVEHQEQEEAQARADLWDERVNALIEECQDEVNQREEQDLTANEKEVNERVAGLPYEEAYPIEEEGWDREAEIFDRALEEFERCETHYWEE